MIDAKIYYQVYIYSVVALSIVHSFILCNQSNKKLLCRDEKPYYALLIVIVTTLFLGFRPIDIAFVDTLTYASLFNGYRSQLSFHVYHEEEFLFNAITLFFARYTNVSTNTYFFVLESLYILPLFFACKRFAKNSISTLLLFFLGSFSFYSYGVNGLRQGIATSFVLLGYSLLVVSQPKKKLAIVSMITGVLFHTSALLPFVAVFIAKYIKKTDIHIAIWIVSIMVSLLIGREISQLLSLLPIGDDDRLANYLTSESHEDLFSSTGFRYDFLLYSSLPIIVGLFFIKLRKTTNEVYTTLFNSYLICNSFWVLAMYANFTNRFAYLSWFMLPLVLSYPLLKFNIFKRQGVVLALLLLFQISTTIILSL